jgi:serine/threonine protein kinase
MINSTIGKYKITRLIGEGGMASVYEAEHEMLGTKVAVKVLNPVLSANAQIRERFKNEAKMMASFNHPNITRIIDFDDQPHQLSIVMEFLEGEDLNDKIKRNGPLSQQEVKDIFVQTLSAFQYAHEKGVVHRDIKPSNIYVLPNGHVKILDFGIAKLFGQGNEMTQTGTQMGTPIYMSPEQVRADKSIDHRSDIYSLGVTMFYAITGKPPYNSDTDSQFDIFNKIVFEPLPELPEIGNFDDFVKKACQKDREQRFQSCEEWNAALRNDAKQPIAGTDDQTVFEQSIPKDREINSINKITDVKDSQDNLNSNQPADREIEILKKNKERWISLINARIIITSIIFLSFFTRFLPGSLQELSVIILIPLNYILLMITFRMVFIFYLKKIFICNLIFSPIIFIVLYILSQYGWGWGLDPEIIYRYQSTAPLLYLLGEFIFQIMTLRKIRKIV